MSELDERPQAGELTTDAWQCAGSAARRHGLRVVELHDLAQHHAAAALLCRIWRADTPDQVINADMIRAFAISGNYVVGAYRDDALVGAAIGFFGAGHLHSHITGVDPTAQSGGVGYALKQHQRAWTLARGIAEVCWTFDPLVRRNAYFNLHKLGALPTAYLPDFYGELTDGVNAGDASDRLYVAWRLDSRRAVAAAHGKHNDVDAGALRGSAAMLVDRASDGPAPVDSPLPADGRPMLVAVPWDIEALRAHDQAASARWRQAVREALTAALAAGYRITGMARDGFYVLEVTR
ncbi:MAG TPA: GNAT family N-acetyltransferase [Micromonosporaceae bacterium]|nr:GNAT family N-acetyltransferase [Micromonosporaceae bacterium]